MIKSAAPTRLQDFNEDSDEDAQETQINKVQYRTKLKPKAYDSSDDSNEENNRNKLIDLHTNSRDINVKRPVRTASRRSMTKNNEDSNDVVTSKGFVPRNISNKGKSSRNQNDASRNDSSTDSTWLSAPKKFLSNPETESYSTQPPVHISKPSAANRQNNGSKQPQVPYTGRVPSRRNSFEDDDEDDNRSQQSSNTIEDFDERRKGDNRNSRRGSENNSSSMDVHNRNFYNYQMERPQHRDSKVTHPDDRADDDDVTGDITVPAALRGAAHSSSSSMHRSSHRNVASQQRVRSQVDDNDNDDNMQDDVDRRGAHYRRSNRSSNNNDDCDNNYCNSSSNNNSRGGGRVARSNVTQNEEEEEEEDSSMDPSILRADKESYHAYQQKQSAASGRATHHDREGRAFSNSSSDSRSDLRNKNNYNREENEEDEAYAGQEEEVNGDYNNNDDITGKWIVHNAGAATATTTSTSFYSASLSSNSNSNKQLSYSASNSSKQQLPHRVDSYSSTTSGSSPMMMMPTGPMTPSYNTYTNTNATTTTAASYNFSANSRYSFVQLVHPRGARTEHVQCTVRRDRGGGMQAHSYQLILEETNKPIILAQKMNLNRTSNYHLFDLTRAQLSSKLSKKSGNYIGKLRAKNIHRNEYVLLNQNSEREEIAGVRFDRLSLLNQFKDGNQPRKMKVMVPLVDTNTNLPIPNRTHDSDAGSLAEKLSAYEATAPGNDNNQPFDLYVFESKDPVFENGNYRLNFNGRVSLPSVKNFQMVSRDHIDDIICQFGKIDEDIFHLDFKAPINACQAFAFALCQFNL